MKSYWIIYCIMFCFTGNVLSENIDLNTKYVNSYKKNIRSIAVYSVIKDKKNHLKNENWVLAKARLINHFSVDGKAYQEMMISNHSSSGKFVVMLYDDNTSDMENGLSNERIIVVDSNTNKITEFFDNKLVDIKLETFLNKLVSSSDLKKVKETAR